MSDCYVLEKQRIRMMFEESDKYSTVQKWSFGKVIKVFLEEGAVKAEIE